MRSINMNGTLLIDVTSAGKALVEVIHTLRKTSELTVKSDPVADLPAVFNTEVHWTDENGRKRKGTFPGGYIRIKVGGPQDDTSPVTTGSVKIYYTGLASAGHVMINASWR